MSHKSNFKEVKESWWIDYLEGEVNEGLAEDMSMLLRHSKTDWEILEGLKNTKECLWRELNVEAPNNPEYLAKIENNIMQAIANEEWGDKDIEQEENDEKVKGWLKKWLKLRKMKQAQYYFVLGN